jgi:hypothetical protein
MCASMIGFALRGAPRMVYLSSKHIEAICDLVDSASVSHKVVGSRVYMASGTVYEVVPMKDEVAAAVNKAREGATRAKRATHHPCCDGDA